MQKAKSFAVNLTAKAYTQAARITVSFNLNNLPLCPYFIGAVYLIPVPPHRGEAAAAHRLHPRAAAGQARQPLRTIKIPRMTHRMAP